MKINDKHVRQEIEKLRSLEKKAFGPNHGRFDFYDYLEAAHQLHCEWSKPKPISHKKRIVELFDLTPRRDRRLLHAIIDASSGKNSKTKNRWVQALKVTYKNQKEVKKVGLRKFVSTRGGLEKCAETKARAKTKRVKSPFAKFFVA